MTEEMEEDLHCIVEWGKKWMVSFNASVLVSIFLELFLHLMSSLLKTEITKSWVSFSISEIPYTCDYSAPQKATVHPCMEYCSHILGGAPQLGW